MTRVRAPARTTPRPPDPDRRAAARSPGLRARDRPPSLRRGSSCPAAARASRARHRAPRPRATAQRVAASRSRPHHCRAPRSSSSRATARRERRGRHRLLPDRSSRRASAVRCSGQSLRARTAHRSAPRAPPGFLHGRDWLRSAHAHRPVSPRECRRTLAAASTATSSSRAWDTQFSPIETMLALQGRNGRHRTEHLHAPRRRVGHRTVRSRPPRTQILEMPLHFAFSLVPGMMRPVGMRAAPPCCARRAASIWSLLFNWTRNCSPPT